MFFGFPLPRVLLCFRCSFRSSSKWCICSLPHSVWQFLGCKVVKHDSYCLTSTASGESLLITYFDVEPVLLQYSDKIKGSQDWRTKMENSLLISKRIKIFYLAIEKRVKLTSIWHPVCAVITESFNEFEYCILLWGLLVGTGRLRFDEMLFSIRANACVDFKLLGFIASLQSHVIQNAFERNFQQTWRPSKWNYWPDASSDCHIDFW